MKTTAKLMLGSMLAIFACGCASEEAPQHNTLTEQEKAEGWQLLFDGKTLDCWKDYNGTELHNWTVVDGCIQAAGSGSDESGYMVTRQQFENFILSWDWKLSKGGNSGMLYHVVERPTFAVPYVTGPEYQLIDDKGWEEANAPTKLEDWQRCGVDYAMYLPDFSVRDSIMKPQGEWNNSVIEFNNGHVTYWMNGVKMVEFDAWTDDWFERKGSGKWEMAPEYGLAHKGVICLQDHGYPASFRNIKIKELPSTYAGKEVSLFNGKDTHGWEAFGEIKASVTKDGELLIESGDKNAYGYLATREYYDNFDLTAEFKQLANGNSGLFFRSIIEGEAKVSGWQVEVAPKGQDTGGIFESYGRGWLAQIDDDKESVLKEGEWNTIRVRVEGDKVQTWLNGVEMVDLSDEAIGKACGRIALQVHDGGGIKVLWRNMNLTTL